VAVLIAYPLVVAAQNPPNHSKLVHLGADGKLVYVADERGNRIPDFSNCGYQGGGVKLPHVPVKETLEPGEGTDDDTSRIQTAIDRVSKAAADAGGFRGAVLLRRGIYRVAKALAIVTSGVVLRGEEGAVLIATGKERRILILVKGNKGRTTVGDTAQEIVDEIVPVGARMFRVASTEGLSVGDTIMVRRKSNKEWIHEIGMDRILPRWRKRKGKKVDGTRQWKPFSLDFDRVITQIEGNRVTVDAPIVCAIEKRWGGGDVLKYRDERISQCGVESLRIVSEFDKTVTAKGRDGKPYCADEQHCTGAIGFDNVVSAWARDITALHLIGGISTGRGAKWVTVQDCVSLDMVSLIAGGRRYPFCQNGQLCLFQRCYAETARHAFAFGSRIPGPNVFLNCRSTKDYGSGEPHHRWSVGGLFDNVHGPLAIQDRQNMGTGHGWSGANYVAWNTEGTLVCQKPPTAQNYAIGHVGKKSVGHYPSRRGRWVKAHPDREVPINFMQRDGHWESYGKHVEPRSLYLKQLEDRLGRQAVEDIGKGEPAPAE